MQVRIGSQIFIDVSIPMLWGNRAVIGHPHGELSIIDLSYEKAIPEVVSDKPWVGVEYTDKEDGFVIYRGGDAAYFYSPVRRILRDLSGKLPECEISKDKIRIGTNTVGSSTVVGLGVGLELQKAVFILEDQCQVVWRH